MSFYTGVRNSEIADLARKTLYKSDAIIITKTAGIIEIQFSAATDLPTKADIDDAAKGESWLPLYNGYELLWNYLSKDSGDTAILSISANSGLLEVRNMLNTAITDYRLYGRVFYVAK